jgi:hypothetical protein
MAKKLAKPKLTEADKDRIEQCFQQVRDQKLRQWYEQANSDDEQIRAAGQARLQLQIWLRETRSEIAILRQDRNACKANGDADGLATTRKKLKHAQCAMAMHVTMSTQGIPTSTASKASRKWVQKTYTLQEILNSSEYDKRSEFGVNRDSILDLVTSREENEETTSEQDVEDIAKDLDSIQLEDGGIAVKSEGGTKDSPNPITIWTQHALHMQDRYQRLQLPDFAIETKLAYQKKLFDQHVARENELHKAAASTPDPDAEDAQHLDRAGISTRWNPVLITTTFSEHSLWELTSPMLWRHFEGGLSWDYPRWVPFGVMRIETVSSSSHLCFEFGVRTFRAQGLVLPATMSTRPLTLRAHCHQSGTEIEFQIAFLASGFVRVWFPARDIIRPDLGCREVPTTLVELTGSWLGPVE